MDLHLPGLPLDKLPGVTKVLQVTNATAALEQLAAFVRATIAEVGESLSPLLRRDARATAEVRTRATEAATVITTAAAPFAQNSYARARLLRQMHASGLLTRREAQDAEQILDLAQ